MFAGGPTNRPKISEAKYSTFGLCHFSPGCAVFIEIKDLKVGLPALARPAWMPALLWMTLSQSPQSSICFMPIIV